LGSVELAKVFDETEFDEKIKIKILTAKNKRYLKIEIELDGGFMFFIYF